MDTYKFRINFLNEGKTLIDRIEDEDTVVTVAEVNNDEGILLKSFYNNLKKSNYIKPLIPLIAGVATSLGMLGYEMYESIVAGNNTVDVGDFFYMGLSCLPVVLSIGVNSLMQKNYNKKCNGLMKDKLKKYV